MPPAKQNTEKTDIKAIDLTNKTVTRPERQNTRQPTLIKIQSHVRLQQDFQMVLSFQPPIKLTKKKAML